jgi:hypothetical protein
MTTTGTKAGELVSEMSARRHELIALMKKQGGGTVAIRLKTDNVDYCYRKERTPEPFYVTGVMNGCPVFINESAVLLGE